jgi:phosphoglycerol geranylgeranyltransferase
MRFFYLEAGSGAPTPIPDDMIQAVKKNASIPVVVGGGIRDPKIAREKVRAGADIIITGTALEKEKNLKKTIAAIIAAIEKE